MKNPCIPENRVDFRLQLVAWIEANELAAKNSPQSADFSNGVAAGVRLALELFDKQGVPAFAELIEALEIARKQMAHRGCGRVRPTSEWAEHGSMSFDNCQCDIRRVDAVRARVKGGAA